MSPLCYGEDAPVHGKATPQLTRETIVYPMLERKGTSG